MLVKPMAANCIRSQPCRPPAAAATGCRASAWPAPRSSLFHQLFGGRPLRPAASRFVHRATASASSDSDDGAPLFSSMNGNGNGATPDIRRPIGLKTLGEMDLDFKNLMASHDNIFPDHDDIYAMDSAYPLSNRVQLSCYGDHIGDNLKDLRSFMTKHLQGAVTGLHLLPIYPSSGDGGFAPITYQEVDPRLGTWEDLEALAEEYEVCLEFMVNHISPQSKYVKDFLEHGEQSQYADMFVNWDTFWPNGEPSQEDLRRIRTRKPEAPVITLVKKDGEPVRLWCTFGAQQIDINPFSESGWKFVTDSLAALCERGAKVIRLDAFGYCTKKPGTRCFFEEPETWDLLERVSDVVKSHGTRLLCEVHEEYKTNIKLARAGYWVYDFALPLLILHAFTFQTAKNLKHWLRICPRRQFTVLDTHDGMGIDDITGLAEVCDVQQLQDVVQESLGCNPNYKYFYDNGAYTGSPHQYNCTYFSALNRSTRQYLLARAIQFWTPGTPMVYYVGLLAGVNDFDACEEQGPRGINRHRYTLEEAEQAMEQPVVRALLDLCRFRNTHPAFNGTMRVGKTERHILEVTWTYLDHFATLQANMQDKSFVIVHTRKSDTDQFRTIRYELAEDESSWKDDYEYDPRHEEMCTAGI